MSQLQLHEPNYPPGWDCKYDTKTGKCYYINYLTKAMQLEDPRIRYRQLQNECASTESIPMQTTAQPLHGSPYHVYPTSNYPPAVQAFQGPNTATLHNVSASPLLAARSQHLQEMSPVSHHVRYGSPSVSRIIHLEKRHSSGGSLYQETSFTTQAETDAAVTKINTMFPTVDDAHIRLLLKKYHNREAVVISALQVEKHPLTTPGPYSTPPPPRHPLDKKHSIITMTPPMNRFEPPSRTSSPIQRAGSCASGSMYGSPYIGEGFRASPKPHSSPKMKLRYLKSIYPKAEEMLLLDILANADNNVQKASQKLSGMGYEKRDTTAPRVTNRDREEQVLMERKQAENKPPPQPKFRSTQEKQSIKEKLQTRYADVADRIITMALESVDYSEEKAIKILEIVMQDDRNTRSEPKQEVKEVASAENEAAPEAQNELSKSDSRSESTTIASSTIRKEDTKSTLAQDDENNSDGTVKVGATSKSPESLSSPGDVAVSAAKAKANRSRFKAKSDHAKIINQTCSAPRNESDVSKKSMFTSPWCKNMSINGPNPNAYRGPNDNLLLTDYIAWNGANPDLCVGKKNIAKGPDSSLRTACRAASKGSQGDLCKGPQIGLAKGSIFANLKMQQISDVKCN